MFYHFKRQYTLHAYINGGWNIEHKYLQFSIFLHDGILMLVALLLQQFPLFLQFQQLVLEFLCSPLILFPLLQKFISLLIGQRTCGTY